MRGETNPLGGGILVMRTEIFEGMVEQRKTFAFRRNHLHLRVKSERKAKVFGRSEKARVFLFLLFSRNA